MTDALRRAARARVPAREWLIWLVVLAAVTGVLAPFRRQLSDVHVALAYLLVVQGGSARGGRPLGFTLASIAFVLFDFVFLPPYGTFLLQNPLDWIVLISFFVTSIVAAQLLYRAQAEAAVARQRADEVDRLASLGAETLNAARAEDALAAIVEVIRTTVGVAECAVYLAEAGVTRLAARSPLDETPPSSTADQLVNWVAQNGDGAAEHLDGTTRVGVDPALAAADPERRTRGILVPLQVRGRTVGVLRVADAGGLALTGARTRVLEALGYYAALAAERVRLVADAERVHALQESHRAKDAVLASVSHDLRTPLTTIKGLAHEIARDGDERAEVIEEEADRLNMFVAKLLDLSRVTSGSAAPDIQPNELEDLIGAAVQQSKGALGDRELSIAFAPGDSLLIGRFDFSQTLRALVNLLENAAKYSDRTQPIELRAGRSGRALYIAVADRGPGVAPADVERIFEPFYRTAAIPADTGGTGLGLSIARGIADAQGGALTYQPREGGGSVFTLTVPAMDLAELTTLMPGS